MKVSDLLKQIADDGATKTASAPAAAPSAPAAAPAADLNDDDAATKLAEDLEAGGRLMADAFVDRTIENMRKLAGLSSHAAGTGVKQPSNWSRVAEKLQKLHGSKTPDDSGHTRAEAVYKRVGAAPAAPKELIFSPFLPTLFPSGCRP